MHRTTEIFDVSIVDVGGNAEHGRQVAEPGIAVRLEIPFPAHRLARLHRQPEPIVGDVALGFRAPELRHVEARADVTNERTVESNSGAALSKTHRYSPSCRRSRYSIMNGSRRSKARVGVQAMRQVCGVHTVYPTIAHLGLEGSPSEVEPRFVEVGAALVWPRNPDE
jgi:hypothetical protein